MLITVFGVTGKLVTLGGETVLSVNRRIYQKANDLHGRNPWQPESNGGFGVRCTRPGFMRTAGQHQPTHSSVSTEYLPNHSFSGTPNCSICRGGL